MNRMIHTVGVESRTNSIRDKFISTRIFRAKPSFAPTRCPMGCGQSVSDRTLFCTYKKITDDMLLRGPYGDEATYGEIKIASPVARNDNIKIPYM